MATAIRDGGLERKLRDNIIPSFAPRLTNLGRMSVAADLPGSPWHVVLRTPNKKNLQDAYGSHRAACTSDRSDSFAWMQLLPCGGGRVQIKSARSQRVVAVRPSGECFFDGGGYQSGETFIPGTARGGWITFGSSKTGKYLTVDAWGDVWCWEQSIGADDGSTHWEILPTS